MIGNINLNLSVFYPVITENATAMSDCAKRKRARRFLTAICHSMGKYEHTNSNMLLEIAGCGGASSPTPLGKGFNKDDVKVQITKRVL